MASGPGDGDGPTDTVRHEDDRPGQPKRRDDSVEVVRDVLERLDRRCGVAAVDPEAVVHAGAGGRTETGGQVTPELHLAAVAVDQQHRRPLACALSLEVATIDNEILFGFQRRRARGPSRGGRCPGGCRRVRRRARPEQDQRAQRAAAATARRRERSTVCMTPARLTTAGSMAMDTDTFIGASFDVSAVVSGVHLDDGRPPARRLCPSRHSARAAAQRG